MKVYIIVSLIFLFFIIMGMTVVLPKAEAHNAQIEEVK